MRPSREMDSGETARRWQMDFRSWFESGETGSGCRGRDGESNGDRPSSSAAKRRAGASIKSVLALITIAVPKRRGIRPRAGTLYRSPSGPIPRAGTARRSMPHQGVALLCRWLLSLSNVQPMCRNMGCLAERSSARLLAEMHPLTVPARVP